MVWHELTEFLDSSFAMIRYSSFVKSWCRCIMVIGLFSSHDVHYGCHMMDMCPTPTMKKQFLLGYKCQSKPFTVIDGAIFNDKFGSDILLFLQLGFTG